MTYLLSVCFSNSHPEKAPFFHTHQPLTTPSTLSMGTTLTTYEARSARPRAVGAIRASRVPWMTCDALLSPGCTRADRNSRVRPCTSNVGSEDSEDKRENKARRGRQTRTRRGSHLDGVLLSVLGGDGEDGHLVAVQGAAQGLGAEQHVLAGAPGPPHHLHLWGAAKGVTFLHLYRF